MPVVSLGDRPKDVPLCRLENGSATTSDDTLEAELQRQLKCLQLCVDSFLESRCDVSNQLRSHQLRLITLLEGYGKSVRHFPASNLEDCKYSSCTNEVKALATGDGKTVTNFLTSNLEDCKYSSCTNELKEVTTGPDDASESALLPNGSHDPEASACFGSDGIGPLSFDSACDVGDLALRWAILTQMTISNFSNIRWPLLSCWLPPYEDITRRSTVMKTVRTKLGAQDQYFDPVVQEWIQEGYYKGRRTTLNSQSFSGASRVLNIKKDMFSRFSSCPVLHPISFTRFAWTVLGLLCVIYDAVLLTLRVFETLETDTINAIDWVLRFFWIADICISFRTGFYVKARYEDRPRLIARKYMSTWFLIDLISLIPDTLITLLDSGASDTSSYSSTFRWLNMFKILRLMRLAKCVNLFAGYLDSLNSTNAILIVHMVKYLLLMIVWVHLCACGWFWIGKQHADSWLSKAKVQHLQLPEIYVISIQWSLSLLQSNTEVHPAHNLTELLFVVATTLLSILVMAVFVSNVTNVLIALQVARDHKARHMRALQEYLHRHQVPAELAEIVRKHAKEKMRVDRKLQLGEDDVTECLPRDLQRKLLQEVRGGMINMNSLVFSALKTHQAKNYEKLCCDMLTPLFFSPGKYVFRYAQACNATYFNIAGAISYQYIVNKAADLWFTNFFSRQRSASMSSDHVREQTSLSHLPTPCNTMSLISRSSIRTSIAQELNWHQDGSIRDGILMDKLQSMKCLVSRVSLLHTQPICEAALFLSWTHMGFVSAETHVAFLSLGSSDFSILAHLDFAFRTLLTDHAIRFCRVLNSGFMHPSDLTTSVDVLNTLQDSGELCVRSLISSGTLRKSEWS